MDSSTNRTIEIGRTLAWLLLLCAISPLPVLGAYWGFYAGALLVLGMLANTLSAELRRTGAALDRRTTDLRRLRDLHLRTVESIESAFYGSGHYAWNVSAYKGNLVNMVLKSVLKGGCHPLSQVIALLGLVDIGVSQPRLHPLFVPTFKSDFNGRFRSDVSAADSLKGVLRHLALQ